MKTERIRLNGATVMVIKPECKLLTEKPEFMSGLMPHLVGEIDIDRSFLDKLFYQNDNYYSRVDIECETFSHLIGRKIVKNKEVSKVQFMIDKEDKSRICFSMDGEYLGSFRKGDIITVLTSALYNR